MCKFVLKWNKNLHKKVDIINSKVLYKERNFVYFLLYFTYLAGCRSTLSITFEVGMSSVYVMTTMHGENLLKKQTNTKIFYCNLESENLSMHCMHAHHELTPKH